MEFSLRVVLAGQDSMREDHAPVVVLGSTIIEGWSLQRAANLQMISVEYCLA